MANGNPETLGERIARLEQRAINQSESLRRIETILEGKVKEAEVLSNVKAIAQQNQALFEALDGEIEYLKEENRKRLTESNQNKEFIKTRFWVVSTIGLLFLALMDFAFRLFL